MRSLLGARERAAFDLGLVGDFPRKGVPTLIRIRSNTKTTAYVGIKVSSASIDNYILLNCGSIKRHWHERELLHFLPVYKDAAKCIRLYWRYERVIDSYTLE